MTNTDDIKTQLDTLSHQHLRMLLDTGRDEINRLVTELQYFIDRDTEIHKILKENTDDHDSV